MVRADKCRGDPRLAPHWPIYIAVLAALLVFGQQGMTDRAADAAG